MEMQTSPGTASASSHAPTLDLKPRSHIITFLKRVGTILGVWAPPENFRPGTVRLIEQHATDRHLHQVSRFCFVTGICSTLLVLVSFIAASESQYELAQKDRREASLVFAAFYLFFSVLASLLHTHRAEEWTVWSRLNPAVDVDSSESHRRDGDDGHDSSRGWCQLNIRNARRWSLSVMIFCVMTYPLIRTMAEPLKPQNQYWSHLICLAYVLVCALDQGAIRYSEYAQWPRFVPLPLAVCLAPVIYQYYFVEGGYEIMTDMYSAFGSRNAVVQIWLQPLFISLFTAFCCAQIHKSVSSAITSASKLQDTLWDLGIPVLRMNLQGEVIEWNDFLADLTGVTSQASGRSKYAAGGGGLKTYRVPELLVPADSDDSRESGAEDMILRSVQRGQPCRVRVCSQRQDADRSTLSRVFTLKPFTDRALADHFGGQVAWGNHGPGPSSRFRNKEILCIGLDLNIGSEFANLRKEADNRTREAATDMLSYVSHEMRNPLHAIFGLLQIIDGEMASIREEISESKSAGATMTSLLPRIGSVATDVKSAIESATMLRVIANDALDIRKIQTGNLVLNPKAVLVGSIYESIKMFCDSLCATTETDRDHWRGGHGGIRSAGGSGYDAGDVDLHRDQGHSKSDDSINNVGPKPGVVIETHASSEVQSMAIVCDISRVQQVAMNLITNAKKFTPELDGRVVVTIEKKCMPTGSSIPDSSVMHMSGGTPALVQNLKNRDQEGVLISVRDNGRGVNPAALHVLFQPFKQVKITDNESGAGLGLYLCQKLSKQMQGCIGYQPADPGSVFWFWIPPELTDSTVMDTVGADASAGVGVGVGVGAGAGAGAVAAGTHGVTVVGNSANAVTVRSGHHGRAPASLHGLDVCVSAGPVSVDPHNNENDEESVINCIPSLNEDFKLPPPRQNLTPRVVEDSALTRGRNGENLALKHGVSGLRLKIVSPSRNHSNDCQNLNADTASTSHSAPGRLLLPTSQGDSPRTTGGGGSVSDLTSSIHSAQNICPDNIHIMIVDDVSVNRKIVERLVTNVWKTLNHREQEQPNQHRHGHWSTGAGSHCRCKPMRPTAQTAAKLKIHHCSDGVEAVEKYKELLMIQSAAVAANVNNSASAPIGTPTGNGNNPSHLPPAEDIATSPMSSNHAKREQILIFMDLAMPRMDGIQATQEILAALALHVQNAAGDAMFVLPDGPFLPSEAVSVVPASPSFNLQCSPNLKSIDWDNVLPKVPSTLIVGCTGSLDRVDECRQVGMHTVLVKPMATADLETILSIILQKRRCLCTCTNIVSPSRTFVLPAITCTQTERQLQRGVEAN